MRSHSVEFNNRVPALNWILHDNRYKSKEVFVSYSSLKMYRDCVVPGKIYGRHFLFGIALHALFLEGKKEKEWKLLTKVERALCLAMVLALKATTIVIRLMTGVKVEQEFTKIVFGVLCKGRIDILAKSYIGDLKSTKLTNKKQFIASMDFLQVAMYFAATGLKDFYYIGVTKTFPIKVFIFNAADYPERIKAAQMELKKYLLMLKKDLDKYKRTQSKQHNEKAIKNNSGYARTKTIVHKKRDTKNVGRGGLHNRKAVRKISHRKEIPGRSLRHINKRK